MKHLEMKSKDFNAKEKELENLYRRHDQLKQKCEELNKDNKKYAKNLVEALKENSDLKEAANKDSEALEDALNTNQVLIEEIKVKNAIIEADNILAQQGEMKNNEVNTAMTRVRCSICDWSSDTEIHLAGHMTKHIAGQYICENCEEKFKTKPELKEHIDRFHKFTCTKCDKVFVSEHSLKQHTAPIHAASQQNDIRQLPVGHPEQAKLKNSKNGSKSNQGHVVCGQCGKAFTSGSEVDDHMLIHIEEEENGAFRENKELKTCRYFKRGVCTKGIHCRFAHVKQNVQVPPQCNKGQMCRFLKQNRCSFFHPGIGVQNPRNKSQPRQAYEKKACRYKSECWKSDTCPFEHPRRGFQFAQKTNRPPMNTIHMNPWLTNRPPMNTIHMNPWMDY